MERIGPKRGPPKEEKKTKDPSLERIISEIEGIVIRSLPLELVEKRAGDVLKLQPGNLLDEAEGRRKAERSMAPEVENAVRYHG